MKAMAIDLKDESVHMTISNEVIPTTCLYRWLTKDQKSQELLLMMAHHRKINLLSKKEVDMVWKLLRPYTYLWENGEIQGGSATALDYLRLGSNGEQFTFKTNEKLNKQGYFTWMSGEEVEQPFLYFFHFEPEFDADFWITTYKQIREAMR